MPSRILFRNVRDHVTADQYNYDEVGSDDFLCERCDPSSRGEQYEGVWHHDEASHWRRNDLAPGEVSAQGLSGTYAFCHECFVELFGSDVRRVRKVVPRGKRRERRLPA